jgi:hypothetical protein
LCITSAFPSSTSCAAQLFTIEPDGSGLKQVTHFRDGSDSGNANWSPDGKRIVFERDFPVAHAGVYTMNQEWLVEPGFTIRFHPCPAGGLPCGSSAQPEGTALAQSRRRPASSGVAAPTSTIASAGTFARRAAARIASGDGASYRQ